MLNASPIIKYLTRFNPASQLPIKLSGSYNFIFSPTQISMLLHGHDLYGRLDGTTLSPPKTIITHATKTVNIEYKDWFQQEKLIQNALIASVNAKNASILTSADNYKALCDHLHTSFAKKSQTHIFSLRHHQSWVNKDNKYDVDY